MTKPTRRTWLWATAGLLVTAAVVATLVVVLQDDDEAPLKWHAQGFAPPDATTSQWGLQVALQGTRLAIPSSSVTASAIQVSIYDLYNDTVWEASSQTAVNASNLFALALDSDRCGL